MPALLALIPFKDWVYLGIITALVAGFGWYTVHERHEGEAHEVAALQKSSAKLVNEANAQIATLTAAHAAELKKVLSDNDQQLQAATVQHNSDTQRLRDADAYRRQHSAIQSAAQSPGATATGTSGASQGGSGIERLEQISSELADGLRDTSAALTACMTERDSVASPLF